LKLWATGMKEVGSSRLDIVMQMLLDSSSLAHTWLPQIPQKPRLLSGHV
jgi:hypothetical protein